MSPKRVRFSTQRTVVFPTMSSPASSVSTLVSSEGPVTPPATSFARNSGHPYSSPHSTPQKYQYRNHAYTKARSEIHPLLAVSQPRALNYDITQYYTHISTPFSWLSSRRGLSSEPATWPPTVHMLLQSSSSQIPFRVTVKPTLNGTYVTISDVLRALYYALHENLTSTEFYALSEKERRGVTTAYKHRYHCIHDRAEARAEREGGIKKVDCFMDKTSFAGLSGGFHSDTWVLHVL